MHKPCKDCPWTRKTWDCLDAIAVQEIKDGITEQIANGELKGPHACHRTKKWIPENEDEICIGHLQHLRSQNES